MKTNKLTLLAMAIAAFVALGTSTAFAVTIGNGFVQVTDSGGGTGVNVLYNPNETGNSVNATINTGPGYMATFTSPSTITTSGGQASLQPVVGQTLRDLSFSLTGGNTFTTLILNPDVVNGQDGGIITFFLTYQMPMGTFNTAMFSLNANGQNFFTVEAINGAVLTTVRWTSTVDIADANQYRIDGINDPSQTVPEGGATLMLLGASLGALAIGRRILLKRPSVV